VNLRQFIRQVLLESQDEWNYSSLTPKRPKPSNKDPWKESGIRFTAVAIQDPEEIKKLESGLQHALQEHGITIPSNWKRSHDYHMTIQLGAMQLRQRIADVGKQVKLEVHSLGVSNTNIALGVSGYMSKKPHQHITVAFELLPSESNEITNWMPLERSFTVTGVITEYRQ